MTKPGGRKQCQPHRGPAAAGRNPQNLRLTAQTRKRLGKHYANKYNTKKGG